MNSTPPSALLRRPGEGRCLAILGDAYTFLATGEDTDGRYALWETVVYPDAGPPLHRHSREEECFYVLEGEITFQLDGERLVAGPGTFVHLPAGVAHGFRNETGRPARMLGQVVPAGLEKMFFEFGAPIADKNTPPPQPTPDDIARLVAIVPDYGIEILAPPVERAPPA